MLVSMAGKNMRVPGQIMEVTDKEAERLIKAKFAEEVKDPPKKKK